MGRIFVAFILASALVIGSAHANDANIHTEMGLAWKYYKNKEYKKARAVVEKHYTRSNGNLSLLLALLDIHDGDCRKALNAISYVSDYYDNHKALIQKDADNRGFYVALKGVGVMCNARLSNWGAEKKELEYYIPYAKGSQKTHAMVALADAEFKLSQKETYKAIDVYQTLLKHIGNSEKEARYRKDALYRLAGLYVLVGDKRLALDSATKLLKNSKERNRWIAKMAASRTHVWILKQPEMNWLKSSK